jgi:hypothetical protein
VSVQIAAAFGLAILGTVASSRTTALTAGGERLPDALAGGYQVAFVLAAVSAAAGLLAALRWLRPPPEAVVPVGAGVEVAVAGAARGAPR